ncbi:hypothetical protein ANN_13451 [Periplaneta americana]|uniref:Uncharacterized protein n=1 Tax=Periplaneta americana TaxID=6978 RepID=A0ABQ8TJG0_PERAM|nr:hypothetical protein ANN_13451 [Periplaneta americana]
MARYVHQYLNEEGMSVNMLQILFKSYGAMYATPEPHNEYTRSVFVQVISSLMLNLWYEMKPPELES